MVSININQTYLKRLHEKTCRRIQVLNRRGIELSLMRRRTTKWGIYARKFDICPEMATKIKLFGQAIGEVMFGAPSLMFELHQIFCTIE